MRSLFLAAFGAVSCVWIMAVVLVACTPGQVPSDVALAQQACVTVQPVLTAGAASGNATAQEIAGYGNAVCGPLAAGSVPATVNSNSPTWLGSLGGMIETLLPLAVSVI